MESHRLILRVLILLSLCIFIIQSCTPEEIQVEAEPFGPTQQEIDEIQARLLAHPLILQQFEGSDYSLLSFNLLDDNLTGEKDERAEIIPPNRFQATFYNYTKNLPIGVLGSLDSLDSLEFLELDYQPLPSQEEYQVAMEILTEDSLWGERLRSGEYNVFIPIPPVVTDSNGERTVTIVLRPQNIQAEAEILGVNIVRRIVIEDLTYIDPSLFQTDPCKSHSNNNCPANGTTGMVKITVIQGSKTIWTFYAVRPAASSGHPSKGSAIELRYVRYKGKLVLWRGHVPILNVEYKNNACGPYRDWMDSEVCFKVNGTDVGNTGFRIASSAPKTILENPNDDSGNFRGVAIHVTGQKVILVSELEAGWYRYVPKWTLHSNGTINASFGFAAVENYCTCKEHYHHAYFRFDTDIQTIGDNTVKEYAKSSIFWNLVKTFKNEGKSYRGSQKKKWCIRNEAGKYYEIIPGHDDGTALGDSFAKGDVWVLKYHSNELEDGVGCVSCGANSAIQIDNTSVNNENVQKKDVVVWYGGHFTHAIGTGGPVVEVVGPTLVPSSNW